jgi:hypothetical protein
MTGDLDHLEVEQELLDLSGVEQTTTMKLGVRPEHLGIEMSRHMP